MKELVFVVWGANKKETELIEGIKKYTENLFGDQEVEITVDDLKTLGEKTYETPCVIFGGVARSGANYQSGWLVPSLNMMLPEQDGYIKYKKKTMDTLAQAVAYILTAKKPEPTTTCVETPEGITVGPDGCQINITEAEAAHLKKIKEILGGGKMIITKGDVKIEVE